MVVAASAILGAIIYNWMPGGSRGPALFRWVHFQPAPVRELVAKPWTLVTSGVLTWPEGISHALFSLFGLYVLGTDLEKRWGGGRLLRFLASSVVLGNLAVLLVDLLPIAVDPSSATKAHVMFHPPFALGPAAAITACAMAWSAENANKQVRLFFFLPVSARALLWVIVGFAALSPLFLSSAPEGVAAPFGGILAGVLFGGTPSPVRSLWLRLRLASSRRGGSPLRVESIAASADRVRAAKRSTKAPPLRVVPGGLDEDLAKRRPPKDKRYLN